MNIIKQISKQDIEKLLKAGIIKNNTNGYIGVDGLEVGYYKTCGNKRYIQDKYLKMLENMK